MFVSLYVGQQDGVADNYEMYGGSGNDELRAGGANVFCDGGSGTNLFEGCAVIED